MCSGTRWCASSFISRAHTSLLRVSILLLLERYGLCVSIPPNGEQQHKRGAVIARKCRKCVWRRTIAQLPSSHTPDSLLTYPLLQWPTPPRPTSPRLPTHSKHTHVNTTQRMSHVLICHYTHAKLKPKTQQAHNTFTHSHSPNAHSVQHAQHEQHAKISAHAA